MKFVGENSSKKGKEEHIFDENKDKVFMGLVERSSEVFLSLLDYGQRIISTHQTNKVYL